MKFKSHLSSLDAALPLRAALGAVAMSAVVLSNIAAPSFAQDSETPVADVAAPAETSTETASDATEKTAEETAAETAAQAGLSTGTPLEDNIGRTYTLETHGDWEIRCIKAPEGVEDPCNMYQLLKDEQGNEVSEFTLFHYGQGEIDAGATIVTPLETLLTEPLAITVDGANGRSYPYSFCNPIGCYARVGMTANDIATLKKGAKAVVTLVPSSAPTQKVNLDVSLTGFTAGYARVTELNLAARAAAAAAQ